MTPQAALYAYRCVYVAFIVWASAKTFLEGWPAPAGHGHGGSAHMGLFIRGLAATEIAAALAFLWLPAQVWAGGLLIAIFAIATAVDLVHGGVPARFAYYSATVMVLIVLTRPGSLALD